MPLTLTRNYYGGSLLVRVIFYLDVRLKVWNLALLNNTDWVYSHLFSCSEN